jgi:hypothetical protein
MDGLRQAWTEYGFWGFLGTACVIALLIYGFKSNKPKGGGGGGGGSTPTNSGDSV